MENLLIFAATVVVYTIGWIGWRVLTFQDTLLPSKKGLLVLAILCLPINVGGNVFTVMGNAVAEKGIYSLFSIYQNAKGGSAFTVFAFGQQIAAEDAIWLLGFPIYQQGATTVFGLGVSGYQRSLQDDASVVAGISIYQRSARDAKFGIGVSAYQRSARDAKFGIGVSAYQHSERNAEAFIGTIGYQNAGEKARLLFGIVGYQRVPGKERVFAVYEPLTKD